MEFHPEELIDRDDILENRMPIHPICSFVIYFLIRDDQITYIGQSRNVFSRILDHIKADKKFDSWSFVECAESEMNYWETYYMHKFKPIENWSHVIGRHCCPCLNTWDYLVFMSSMNERNVEFICEEQIESVFYETRTNERPTHD